MNKSINRQVSCFLALLLLSVTQLNLGASAIPLGALHPNIPKYHPLPSRQIQVEVPQKTGRIFYWIPIPVWLAGTWQTNRQTILSMHTIHGPQLTDLPKEIAINRVSKIGCQRDNRGTVWHIGAPNSRIIQTKDFTEYHTTQSMKLISSSPASFVVSCKSDVSRVSKVGNELIDCFKEETIVTYTPLANGIILSDFLINDFDLDGKPLSSSRATCVERRIRPYQTVDEDGRGNLKVLFHEFLLDTGRLHLLPYNVR